MFAEEGVVRSSASLPVVPLGVHRREFLVDVVCATGVAAPVLEAGPATTEIKCDLKTI
jgi:hypothetical protein